MSITTTRPERMGSTLLAIVMAVGLVGPVAAQGKGEAPGGNPPYHDITAGPPVTGSPIAGGPRIPGTSPSPETAGRLYYANLCVSEHMEAGVLASALTGEMIPYDVQKRVLRVLMSEEPSDTLGMALALGGPEDPGYDLAEALVGLADDRRTGQLNEAIDLFNELMESRDEEFLENPSDELVTVHAVLSILALRAQCQLLERIEVCVLTPENMLTTLEAIIHPLTEDTLITDQSVTEVLDSLPRQYGVAHDWYVENRPVTFHRTEFVKAGAARTVPMDSVRRIGAIDSVAVFARVGARRPYSEILVPEGPGCEFQPYSPSQTLPVCVVTPAGALTTVRATFHPATGDTLVAGIAFGEMHHAGEAQYAAGQSWFIEDAPISHGEREYVKFGVPQLLTQRELRRVGERDGVPIFTRAESAAPYTEIFIPIGPGCEFQPYLARVEIRIRG